MLYTVLALLDTMVNQLRHGPSSHKGYDIVRKISINQTHN